MGITANELSDFIEGSVLRLVDEADTVTEYRRPLVGFASTGDPGFGELKRRVEPAHLLPEDLLPGAKSVVAFFLPFARWVVEANAVQRGKVAEEWCRAYIETNALINSITSYLKDALEEKGVRAASEPATHNYDPETLVCRWSHKSMAVICGLGSFGLHHMVITDSGCAGRFGSLVIDAGLPVIPVRERERCLYFYDGSCVECIERCPVKALDREGRIDKHLCNRRLLAVEGGLQEELRADVCGKCAIGPCSFESAVKGEQG